MGAPTIHLSEYLGSYAGEVDVQLGKEMQGSDGDVRREPRCCKVVQERAKGSGQGNGV